jgi:hypothetical protein
LVFDLERLPPDKRPIACLETLGKMSRKMAVAGLRQAINDCVEMSLRFSHAEVAAIDAELSARGIIRSLNCADGIRKATRKSRSEAESITTWNII